MPPQYFHPHDVIQPNNPMGDAQPNKFLLPIVDAGSRHYSYSDSLQ